MHLSRRMRLIWHKLWLIPLVGATADVVASEAAKLGGVTVPIPWLFSAIGVAGMLGAAVVRAYSVPLIPEGLETPDEALTRRSRVLGERLGATPVRVFVSDLPKLRGKVDTFLDGHDLFVSKRVAALPEAERDFVLARALAWRVRGVTTVSRDRYRHLICSATAFGLGVIIWPVWEGPAFMLFGYPQAVLALSEWFWKNNRIPLADCKPEKHALRATGSFAAAISALRALREPSEQSTVVEREVADLARWWKATGQTTVEASEWYQRERGLAAKAE